MNAPTALPPGLERSFGLAAAELGMCSAAWLFAETLQHHGGAEALQALGQELGDVFPVLGQVTDMAQRGPVFSPPNAAPVLEALQEASTVLVVGLEARWLDVLVPALGARRVALLAQGLPQTDWDRVASNLGEQLEIVDMDAFQRLAGSRSALLTFVYGVTHHRLHVVPAWLRVMGPDIRTQFRTILGWDVLGEPLDRYPRFLVDTSPDDFTELVP